ncbi:MAG: meiotic recombination protein Spo11/DNA topoisomerase VI subunit A [Amphiamblys sp. WSBS2006]|nr:MAG: meiotic recombination protein Spo11/DNA topoisomerase VI subunit A [Amphiamblys sp. WSBS2006]
MHEEKQETIRKVILDILYADGEPVFRIPQRNRKDKKISLFHRKTSKTFLVYSKILLRMYSMLQLGTYCTKRDIFYEAPQFYKKQETVNKAIDDLAGLLQCPSSHLGVRASSKGLIHGDIRFILNDGTAVDCSRQGTTFIPVLDDVLSVEFQENTVFVIIEKEATFRAFIQSDHKEQRAIAVTGKGYPCTATRQFMNFIEKTFQPRIGILVDFDPHGYRIGLMYKKGVLDEEKDERCLTVSSAVLLGVKYEDLVRHQSLVELALLTSRDRTIATNMAGKIKNSSSLQEFFSEITAMLGLGKKAELQAICDKETGQLPPGFISEKLHELF